MRKHNQILLLGTSNSNCLQSVRGEAEEFLKYVFIHRQLEDTLPSERLLDLLE